MNKFFPLTVLFLLLSQGLWAQELAVPQVLPTSVQDALRLTDLNPLGSARFMGTGGSMTPIGVDYTTLHTNPAGIGWNRTSFASASVGYSNLSNDARLRGNAANRSASASEGSLIVPNLGFVYAGEGRSVRWPTINYGISLVRLADFNETIQYAGSSQRSIIDGIVEDLNAFDRGEIFFEDLDPNRELLILDIDPSIGTDILDPADDNRAIRYDEFGYFSEFDLAENAGQEIDRSGTVVRSGGINEVALGVGGNYDNSILWGISIGIPFMNYSEQRVYDEVDRNDNITVFDEAAFDENTELDGTGFNFKFGAIYLPTPQSRISLSIHSPTYWTLDEAYNTELTYNYTLGDDALGGTAQSDLNIATINFSSPWRFNLGGGYLINTNGFISADVEYVNYKGGRFGVDDFAEFDAAADADIDATLGGAINAKIGGELNLKPFQVRAGVGYRTLPVATARYGEDEGFLTYSGGAGYSIGKFFVDAAVRFESASGYFAPYRTFALSDADGGALDPNIVDVDRTRITGAITVGFRGF